MASADVRSVERLRYHFEVERALAERLRRSTREQRTGGLYTEVYNELFRRVADHPQNLKKGRDDRSELDAQLTLLSRYLRPAHRYLELGAGDCALTFRVAERAREAIAVDVSDVISAQAVRPANFRLVLSDGINLPLPDRYVDVAYSNQLMEHLHPDDAPAQLREIRRVLKPGGVYLCRTPNRLTGPHDISGYFGETACGFHLKEYDHGELVRMLREAGFGAMRVVLSGRGRVLTSLPPAPFVLAERLIAGTPAGIRWRVRSSGLAHKLLGICLAAYA